jgi:hypothetical protein
LSSAALTGCLSKPFIKSAGKGDVLSNVRCHDYNYTHCTGRATHHSYAWPEVPVAMR